MGLRQQHICRREQHLNTQRAAAGTVTHMAPELIANGLVSTACDVYAFGIFMWECYTCLTPYKGLMPPQALSHTRSHAACLLQNLNWMLCLLSVSVQCLREALSFASKGTAMSHQAL